jgi:hypothetical protein
LDDFKESIRKEFKETYKNKVMEKIRGKSKWKRICFYTNRDVLNI